MKPNLQDEILSTVNDIESKVDTVDSNVDLIKPETDKIDGATTDGLAGTNNSLAYRVHEIEKHFHSPERWIGAAALPSGETHVADSDVMDYFRFTGGNDDFGSWVQIVGSSDLPIRSGMVKADIHRFLFSDVSVDKKIIRIQIAYGETGAGALAAGDYSEIMVTPEKDAKHAPLDMMMPRISAGTKVWVRIWVSGQNGSTADMFFGIHEYPG